MALNLVYIVISAVFPIVGVMSELDPFYSVFELILPSRYERSIPVIVVVPIIRLFFSFICVFEFVRFISTLIFLCITVIFTIVTCLRQLMLESSYPEVCLIHLYTQLQIILKTGDYFIRYVLMLLMVSAQVLIVTMWWTILKCWHQLPIYFTFVCGVVTSFTTLTVMILLPRGVEISNASQKFIENQKAIHHTFDRNNKNRYYFLRWYSQRMLPIRFGVQFTLSEDIPNNYLSVLMTNLTNSILLINP